MRSSFLSGLFMLLASMPIGCAVGADGGAELAADLPGGEAASIDPAAGSANGGSPEGTVDAAAGDGLRDGKVAASALQAAGQLFGTEQVHAGAVEAGGDVLDHQEVEGAAIEAGGHVITPPGIQASAIDAMEDEPIGCVTHACSSGERCIGYYGFPGSSIGMQYMCGIPCGGTKGDSACPEGRACISVIGPGPICVLPL